MVTLRFGKEYRMDLSTDTDGKKTRKMIYVGPLYDYEAIESVHNRQRVFQLMLGLLAVVLFITGFSFYSNLSRVWFSSVPYACNLIVLYWYTESNFYFWKYRASLTREQKEKGADRFKSMSLISVILCFLSLIGAFVAMFTYLDFIEPSDYIYVGIDICIIMVMTIAHIFSKKILYKEKENPMAKEWKNK